MSSLSRHVAVLSRSLSYCGLLPVWLMAGAALAQPVESAYTSLDLEADCRWEADDGEVSMGGSAVCSGYGEYPVHVGEGDLRMFAAFGPAAEPFRYWQSFMQFNHVNEVVEWRLRDGEPFAAILRYFVDNQTPDTGIPEGQMLVISTVAGAGGESCVVGYVDARANPEANTLARQVADTVVPGFVCGEHEPRYFGERGETAGSTG